ncbi:MAG: Gfo/Idh/MocA family oxidoreductase [Terrimicrobiaceae bacterium]|nr:Gfo/Idh/MocA family oxidoreductase [Terrimicrobiaceae bacterium]
MFRGIAGCALVAVADIDMKKAVRVSERHGSPKPFQSLGEMLDSEDVDAISIVTPDADHVAVTTEAISRGKHVLCEKPLAPHADDAQLLASAATSAGVINMVNFSYRSAPAIQRAYALIRDGEIGDIVHIEASYLQSWLSDQSPGWRSDPSSLWRLSSRHSQGALGDVGVHILDFASYPVGDIDALSCRVQSFDGLKGTSVGEYILDANDSAVIQVEFANGALGVIHATRWASGHPNSLRLRIFGTLGSIVIDLDASSRRLFQFRGRNSKRGRWRRIDCPRTPNNYERFIRSILTGVNDQPDFARGAYIQNILKCCEESSRIGSRLTVDGVTA